jgi:hypothetical protein
MSLNLVSSVWHLCDDELEPRIIVNLEILKEYWCFVVCRKKIGNLLKFHTILAIPTKFPYHSNKFTQRNVATTTKNQKSLNKYNDSLSTTWFSMNPNFSN